MPIISLSLGIDQRAGESQLGGGGQPAYHVSMVNREALSVRVTNRDHGEDECMSHISGSIRAVLVECEDAFLVF